jgi:Ca-activated chloride channel family protein
MTFLAPWWLLLLLPVAGLAVVYLVFQRRRTRYAVRFATLPLLERVAPSRPGWRRHAPAVAFLLAIIALALAVARPAADVRVPRERATVLVAVDTSLSMRATDIQPNRFAAAQRAAKRFITDLPKKFNVGLVSFSGTADVVVAPTTDHDQVAAGVDRLQLGERTAIGEAVFTSLGSIASLDAQAAKNPPPARIVLLSDGGNTTGRSLADAADAAKKASVPVSTIAYGTAEGELDQDGQMLRVPVDEDALRTLAQDTGGSFHTATSSKNLRSVYDDIGSSIGWRTEQHEVTAWMAAVALVFAMAAGAASLLWFSRLP